MLKWFIRFPEFTESTDLNESSAPFRKSSNICEAFVKIFFVVSSIVEVSKNKLHSEWCPCRWLDSRINDRCYYLIQENELFF